MRKFLLIPPVLFLILILIYIFLYKIYIPRISAFGCFDDCFNIVAGYFMTQGEVLYRDIPFNHQRLMADISFFIQSYFNPVNITDLILKHRQALMVFSFFMNFLIVIRFGLSALGFVILFEFSKFYLFGDRFLAESFIVYPLTYLIGLLWLKLKNQRIHNFEYIFAAFLTWFIAFAREPFIPAVLLLYSLIIWRRRFEFHIVSSLILVILTLGTLLLTPIDDYFYNVFYVNSTRVLESEINLLKSFLYPFYLLIGGKWNIFWGQVMLIDLAFIVLMLSRILKEDFKKIITIFLILGLANIRYVDPGTTFYSAFHMVPWFGMFVFISFLMLKEEIKLNKAVFNFSALMLVLGSLLIIFSHQSFIKEKNDPHAEFITNYGNYLQVGEVIKSLSLESNTLFVDGFDELIYWQAKLPSSYKYNWYTSFMPHFSRFSIERKKMFADNPPDFYYGSCPKEKNTFRLMPDKFRKNYVRLTSSGDPTCVFIKKEKLKEINDKQWKKAAEFLYDKPI